jgi:hypothetical protein
MVFKFIFLKEEMLWDSLTKKKKNSIINFIRNNISTIKQSTYPYALLGGKESSGKKKKFLNKKFIHHVRTQKTKTNSRMSLRQKFDLAGMTFIL